MAEPHVELVTTRLDFGLVRLKGSAVRQLTLRNTSATCTTPWELMEVSLCSSCMTFWMQTMAHCSMLLSAC